MVLYNLMKTNFMKVFCLDMRSLSHIMNEICIPSSRLYCCIPLDPSSIPWRVPNLHNKKKGDNEIVMSLSIFLLKLFQQLCAHKCNCNEPIEFRTKIVHRSKTSSIKLTSGFIGGNRKHTYDTGQSLRCRY